jgi:hypothetical protein
MATLNTEWPSLVDVLKRLGPDGIIMPVAEFLQQTNPILHDLPWKEGNLPTGHTFGIRTALPTPEWRRYNQGVGAGKSQSETYTESCGMMEKFSKLDVALGKLNGNGPAWRLSENKAFVQGFNHEFVRAMLYESVKDSPEKIHGIISRLNASSNADRLANPAVDQIIDAPTVAGGAAASGNDATSILCIGWGEETVYGIFPKGSKAGLQHEDLGKQLVKDSGGVKEYTAWVDHWKWDCGIAVQDYRYVGRVCNIDTSIWKADLTTGPDLTLCFDAAIDTLKEENTVRPVLYCRKETFQMWRQQMIKKGTPNLLEYIQRGVRKDYSYMGIPIVRVDAMSKTETPVLFA